jgi:hypothetical protein
MSRAVTALCLATLVQDRKLRFARGPMPKRIQPIGQCRKGIPSTKWYSSAATSHGKPKGDHHTREVLRLDDNGRNYGRGPNPRTMDYIKDGFLLRDDPLR